MLGVMAKVVGKGLAPYLKALAGSWWLAQFDLHAEAAAAARDAFQIAFSGPKQKEALLFTRTEVRHLVFSIRACIVSAACLCSCLPFCR